MFGSLLSVSSGNQLCGLTVTTSRSGLESVRAAGRWRAQEEKENMGLVSIRCLYHSHILSIHVMSRTMVAKVIWIGELTSFIGEN